MDAGEGLALLVPDPGARRVSFPKSRTRMRGRKRSGARLAYSPSSPPTRFQQCAARLMTSPRVTVASHWPQGLLGKLRVNSQPLQFPGRERPGSVVSAA